MAILSNVSFSCNISLKPSLSSLPNSTSSRSPCLLRCSQEGKEVISPLESVVWSLGEEVSKRSLLALVSASLFFVDPALAFKATEMIGPALAKIIAFDLHTHKFHAVLCHPPLFGDRKPFNSIQLVNLRDQVWIVEQTLCFSNMDQVSAFE